MQKIVLQSMFKQNIVAGKKMGYASAEEDRQTLRHERQENRSHDVLGHFYRQYHHLCAYRFRGDLASRVFNAETIIVGFVAGALGILTTLLLNIPISYIINRLVDVSGIARLPVYGAVGLFIIISMLPTVVCP